MISLLKRLFKLKFKNTVYYRNTTPVFFPIIHVVAPLFENKRKHYNQRAKNLSPGNFKLSY